LLPKTPKPHGCELKLKFEFHSKSYLNMHLFFFAFLN